MNDSANAITLIGAQLAEFDAVEANLAREYAEAAAMDAAEAGDVDAEYELAN